jgi:hypothetical protein
LDIPDFLRRTPDNKMPAPVQAAKAEALTQGAPTTPSAASSFGASPHYKAGDLKATVQSAVDDFLKGNAFIANNPEAKAKSLATIERVIGEKFATGKNIAKEVPGFDLDDFLTSYVYSRSVKGGTQLRDLMKQRYPRFAPVFDKHLSEKAFSTIFKNKATKKDGTRK